jgi:hypothetical protein
MALVRFDVGQSADLLSPADHDRQIRQLAADTEARRIQGRKMMKFELIGTVASSAITLGLLQPVGPTSGYLWSVGRLIAWGLTAGTTPDQLNVFFNNVTGTPEWQLNGNNWAYTFGKGELTMHGGDTILFANSGSLAATGAIVVKGEVRQVPEEAQGELI